MPDIPRSSRGAKFEDLKPSPLTEHFPIPAYVCSAPHGTVSQCNAPAAALWGLEAGLPEGFVPRLFRPDGSPLPASEYPARVVKDTGRPLPGLEALLESGSGLRIPVMLKAAPILGTDGAFDTVVVWVERLDEFRQFVLKARLEDGEMEAHMSLLGVTLFEVDLNSGQVRHTKGFWERLGFPAGTQIEGMMAWRAMVHPDDLDRTVRTFQDAKEKKTGYALEYRLLPPDGIVRWVQSSTRMILDQAGEPVRLVGLARDITERKRAEAAQQSSEESFRHLADQMPGLIFSSHVEHGCEFVNRQFCELAGITQEDARGWGWMDIVHPEDRGRIRRERDEGVKRGEEYDLEYRARTPDGSYHWILVRSRPLQDDSGRVVRWVGAGVDIDRLRAEEEQRRQAQKLESIGLLAAGIARDFSELLGGIVGNAAQLDLRLHEGDPNRELLARIQGAGEQAADLTRQMLAFSGAVQSSPEILDLQVLAVDLEPMLRARVAKKIRLVLAPSAAAAPVLGDAAGLQQLLLNLVLNSAEAIGDEVGRITIEVACIADLAWPNPPGVVWRAGRRGTAVSLTVTDTGPGIPAEIQAKVFDPFFSTRHSGRGLGLAAAQGIAQSHGGMIEVESQAGHGCTLRVLLPAAEGVSADHSHGGEDAPAGTILMVEDDEFGVQLVVAGLREHKCRVLLARDFREATERFKALRGEIHAVVLDVSTSLVGGVEILGAIRKISPDMPILVTHSFEGGNMGGLEGLGVSGFLKKPYSASELVERLRAIAPCPSEARSSSD